MLGCAKHFKRITTPVFALVSGFFAVGTISISAPTLYQIQPFTGVHAVDLPDADFTFVGYYTDWCRNCKLVKNAFIEFKSAHPNLKITHVRIKADTAKMQKKEYRSKPCPVTI